jgi:hypothetical protein
LETPKTNTIKGAAGQFYDLKALLREIKSENFA